MSGILHKGILDFSAFRAAVPLVSPSVSWMESSFTFFLKQGLVGCFLEFNDIFHLKVHRCRSKQIIGGAKNFWSHFPKLSRKVFVQLLSSNFLSQRSWRPFVGVTSKKVFVCFSANLERCFSRQTLGATFARILRDFAQILQYFSWIFRVLLKISDTFPNFSQIKTSGRELAHPAPPAATPLSWFHHGVIFLSWVATPIRFHPHSRIADKATVCT